MSTSTAAQPRRCDLDPATASRVAAVLIGLHLVTHDDRPLLRVMTPGAVPCTPAVDIDPAESFAALAARVASAPDVDEPSDHVLVIGPTPAPRRYRLRLVERDDRMEVTHDGSPGAELDAATLAALHRTILDQARDRPQTPVGRFVLLSAADRHRVLDEFNDTDREFPDRATLHGLFGAQARRTPDAIAISTDREQMTYRELDERTDRLARQLTHRGVRRGDVVGVLSERCLDLPVAILAVLRAGAAYLPLDPGAPARRLTDLVLRGGAPVVLAQPGVAVPENLPAIVLDLGDPGLYAEVTDPVDVHVEPGDLAYVIFTSGSTGTPKGVMVEHRSVVNRLHWMQRRYPLSERDTLLQKTPIVFDVSVWELFWWFWGGARLHLLAPGMERFPLAVERTVRTQRVTAIHFVPSMLGMFLDHLDHLGRSGAGPDLTHLRWVFASGESLPASAVTTFAELVGTTGPQLVNLYGPTEATVDVTGYDCPLRPVTGSVPIGRPIDNTRIYVLRDGRSMPVGAYGTIFLAGVGVARGYLGDPALTERRFVPELGREGAERMYDTGDIGRWLPSGDLEFLGRDDTQVKIRGIRIDLGEIENVLLGFRGVGECVLSLDHPDPTLPVLRAAVSGSAELNVDDLRGYVAERLPAYMLPADYHRFDALPRTASGKLDRAALADLSYVEEHGHRL